MSQAAPTPAPTPTPAGPAVPIWTCQFADPTSGSNQLDNLTVGTKFAMACKGDIDVEWGKDSPRISFAKEEDAYSLVVLKAEKLEPREALFEVTGYKAGEHKPDYIRVLQGQKGFEVSKPVWTIKSVLKPNEQANPYGSFGPFNVGLPLWITILAVLLGLALIGFGFRFFRRRVQRRRVREMLKLHRTALPPAHQFYRDARSLRRRLHAADSPALIKSIAADLNRDFRLMLLRQFEIPALEWSDAAISADLRRTNRDVWEQSEAELRRTLRELTRLTAQETIAIGDVEQLHRMCLAAAERLESVGGRRRR